MAVLPGFTFLQSRTWNIFLIYSRVFLAALTSVYGPKYFAFLIFLFLVRNTRGYASSVTAINGKDLSSFKSILYIGLFFLIRLPSSINASASFPVMI